MADVVNIYSYNRREKTCQKKISKIEQMQLMKFENNSYFDHT